MKTIFGTIRHSLRVAHSQFRESGKASDRSPRWAGVRDHFLEGHPSCAACGGREHVQVHHKQPFHEFPELELDLTNLISLCMGPAECHLLVGHGGNYKFYNPAVEQDAAESILMPAERPAIVARAKTARLVNADPKA